MDILMGARVALDKCRAYPSICPSHTSVSNKISLIQSEIQTHAYTPPKAISFILANLKKKKKSLSWFSLSSKTDWTKPHLPPREEWLQLHFVSLCVNAACKTPNTPETAKVICTLNLDLGACSTIKCLPG